MWDGSVRGGPSARTKGIQCWPFRSRRDRLIRTRSRDQVTRLQRHPRAERVRTEHAVIAIRVCTEEQRSRVYLRGAGVQSSTHGVCAAFTSARLRERTTIQ